MYILTKHLDIGEYLFHLLRDKRELIAQPNFNSKISNVFKKYMGLKLVIGF